MRFVRLPLSALLLLPAFAVFGQPVVGPEVLSSALSPAFISQSFAAPAVAMARDRSGVAIAWMMSNAAGATRVYVARLDLTAHATGETLEIPAASTATGVAASYPSLAPSLTGDGFTLAWMESWDRSEQPLVTTVQAVYCQLDAALQPTPPVVFFAAPTVAAPAIVRSGRSRSWITVDGIVLEVLSNGSLQTPQAGGDAASDMTVATDFPQLISGRSTTTFVSCGSQPFCENTRWSCDPRCQIFQSSYLMKFTALYTARSTTDLGFLSDAQPALNADGDDLLAAWFNGDQTKGGTVFAARVPAASFASFPGIVEQANPLGPFTPDSGPTRPDIATDGERYVVVWRIKSRPSGDHDIVGASLDRNGIVTPFSIATSSADERDPSIIALGNGVFLVAYESFSDGVRRIAGRYVTFGGRRHAVR